MDIQNSVLFQVLALDSTWATSPWTPATWNWTRGYCQKSKRLCQV